MTDTTAGPSSALARVLERLCRLFAFFGGAVLVALMLMAVYSIVMRYFFNNPIAGDFELIQLGCAACVAAFLPYAQLRGSNIIVDFFTTKTSARTQQILDGIGALSIALVMGLLAWRTSLGALGVKSAGETSMIMSVPVWYSYALMVPGFALTTLVALHSAYNKFKGV